MSEPQHPSARRSTARRSSRSALDGILAAVVVAALLAALLWPGAISARTIAIDLVVGSSIALLAFRLWYTSTDSAGAGDERLSTNAAPDHVADLRARVLELEQHLDALGNVNDSLVTSERAAVEERGDALVAIAERARHTELFEAALRTVPIAMAIIDPKLRYIRVNAACANMTGQPVEAHPGRTLREVNPLFKPELEAAMRRVLATGDPCLNYRLTRPTPHAPGGVLEISMHITAFHDTDGAIAGICSTATDMTDWKRLQEQFFQAQKLEAVGQLAAGIAHDFNNLVTVMGSYCDLMLMELPANSAYRNDVEEIRSAANRATTLARRMMGTVRTTAFAPTQLDMRETVLAAHDLLKHALRPNLSLRVQCAEGTGVVLADGIQIEQMLLNLVINAVDAMPDGGAITIATDHVVLERDRVTRVGEIPAGEYVEVIVSDTGTGMDAATLDRIFEPFFTTKPPGKGTGLGLATVLGISRELSGGVEVTSVLGAGTAFRLLIPRAADRASFDRNRTPVRGNFAHLRGTETLLLVNDEDALRAGVARIFTRHGYHVLEARHGGEALRMIAMDPAIDLVVSDLHMPGVGGHELSARLRDLGLHLPVLFMSSSTEEEGALVGLPATADSRDRFLRGPFEADMLLSAVREILADRS